jgi:hypothetical protein
MTDKRRISLVLADVDGTLVTGGRSRLRLMGQNEAAANLACFVNMVETLSLTPMPGNRF